MKLLLLSRENLSLAKAEAERLHGVEGSLNGNHLFLDVDKHATTLAFTRSVHDLLFEAEQLDHAAAEHDWPLGSFAVRAHGREAELASIIWHALQAKGIQPKVDLEYPENEFHFFDGLATRLLWQNQERFSERRSHLRKANHPSSLSPKLARAMINLAGKTLRILDPFCGSGGILLEGSLMGKEMKGYDLDPRQVARAKQNVGEDVFVDEGDARDVDLLGRCDAIVTDLPFGKNTSLKDAEQTFTRFFQGAGKVTDTIIVATHTGFPLEQCAAGWKVLDSFDWYLHKSLSKKIYVLSNPAP